MPKKTPLSKKATKTSLFSPAHKALALLLLTLSFVGLGTNLPQKDRMVLGDRIAIRYNDDGPGGATTKPNNKVVPKKTEKDEDETPLKTTSAKKDSCGTGATCKKLTGTACLRAGGDVSKCKTISKSNGSCCVPNKVVTPAYKPNGSGSKPLAKQTPPHYENCKVLKDKAAWLSTPTCKPSCKGVSSSAFMGSSTAETAEGTCDIVSTNFFTKITTVTRGVCCYLQKI